MDRIGCHSGFWGFFYFWPFNHPPSGPLLPHLLWNHHRFLHDLYQKDSVESEGMVFQKMGLGNSARIGLWSFDGSECLIKAGDREIHRALFGLADLLEGTDLRSDRWLASVSISLDGHLASFWC